jgi:hypothetical protein
VGRQEALNAAEKRSLAESAAAEGRVSQRHLNLGQEQRQARALDQRDGIRCHACLPLGCGFDEVF